MSTVQQQHQSSAAHSNLTSIASNITNDNNCLPSSLNNLGQSATAAVANLPAGTTISAVSVKQERHDEAEIQEMAAKLLEAQKIAAAKHAAQQMANRSSVGGVQTLPLGVGGQANILNYLTRKPNNQTTASTSGTNVSGNTNVSTQGNSNGQPSLNAVNGKQSLNSVNGDNNVEEKKACDEESQKGHFGWATFGKIHIPYISRQSEKYCAVRMVEMKLLNKYLSYLHPDIYSSCTCVRSYYITEAESKLFNEINHKHCDSQFGRDMFTLKDLVVRLSDANKFYQFLDICYRKLLTGSKSSSDKCGFIRINKESVVPYTVRNGEQVVPLFYFEGETENLRQKADYLSGWDLAYLKFCCKVQGIRNELFSSESVAVISLTDIKSYFPTGTEFEDYWPSKVVDSNLLIATKNPSNSSAHWTRQPSAPPPKVINTTVSMPKAPQQQVRKVATSPYNPTMQNSNAAARMNTSNIVATQSGITAAVQALTNGWSLPQAQGPLGSILAHSQSEQLFRVAQAHNQQQNQRAYPPNRNQIPTMISNAARQQYSYNNGLPITSMNCQQTQQPPPLVRSQSQNQCHMSNFASGLPLQQSSSQPQQQPNIQRSISSDYPKTSTKQLTNHQSLTPYNKNVYALNHSFAHHQNNTNNTYNIHNQSQFSSNKTFSSNNLSKVLSTNELSLCDDDVDKQVTDFADLNINSILSPPVNSPELGPQIKQNPSLNSISSDVCKNLPLFACNSNICDSSSTNRLENEFNMTPDLISQLVANPSISTYISSAMLSPVSPLSHIPYSSPSSPSPIPSRQSHHSPQSSIRQKSVLYSENPHHSPVPRTITVPSSFMTNTKEYPVIDLSSPQRSTVTTTNAVTASAVLQQHQHQQHQQQQQRMVQNVMSNGRTQGSISQAEVAAAMHLQRQVGSTSQQAVIDHQNNQRLCIIPEIPAGNLHVPPYKVQKVFVFENIMVPCINMKAYNDSDQLMTLTDFRAFFFPNVQLDHCKRLIEALNVDMYKGNRRQIQTLNDSGKPHSDNIPLIQVRDVIKYMPQLKYMMRNQEQPPNKRVRIS